jgi:iron complex outermembrane receptor protein
MDYKGVWLLSGVVSLGGLVGGLATFPAVAAEVDMGDITVTGTREEAPRAESAATVDTVSAANIETTRPAHPSEIMDQVPGVHVSVTGGEGHQTAIRQPITTNAVYLYLEDGIPTRSTGFFNHNALYEVNIPQAEGIEVTKGPGTSLYGSDAIGGIVNVTTRPAPEEFEVTANLESGSFGWSRLLLSGGDSWESDGVRADLNLTHTDGWRDGTGYDRQSATLRWDRFLDSGASLKTVVTASDIDQETAGSSRLLQADYEDDPTKNTTPISYRQVGALRLSTAYEKESADTLLSLTAFMRQNTMDLMANWSLGYDPTVQETSSNSLGLLAKYRMDFAPMRTRLIVGADIDHTPGAREEYSIEAVKSGDIYTSYTVDEKIYDYDVTYQGISPYLHVETSPTEKLRLSAGLRYDMLSYDYDNRMADGALAVTITQLSTPTKEKVITYNHPADTSVDFSHLSPKLGATYQFSPTFNGFVSYRHAFRAPSEGQLFRPGTTVASLDLEPVKVDSYEVGVRGKGAERVSYELSVYQMTKTDDLLTYQDPDTGDRSTVNAGETLHQGVELGLQASLSAQWQLALSYAWNKHTYEEWVVNSTTDYSGNEIASAPSNVANTRLSYKPTLLNGGQIGAEWVHLGSYWMDENNTQRYDGHDIYHLRINYPLAQRVAIYARVMNLTDERYATAAAYTPAGGWSAEKFEYAPGMPRTFYAGINFTF